MIAFLSITVNLLIGVVYGLISGYFGGWIDNVMQRFIEILVGIPSMVILTLLLLVMKPGIASIGHCAHHHLMGKHEPESCAHRC